MSQIYSGSLRYTRFIEDDYPADFPRGDCIAFDFFEVEDDIIRFAGISKTTRFGRHRFMPKKGATKKSSGYFSIETSFPNEDQRDDNLDGTLFFTEVLPSPSRCSVRGVWEDDDGSKWYFEGQLVAAKR